MSLPNNMLRRFGVFGAICLVIAALTLVFVGGNLFIIVIRGIGSLPEHLAQRETMLAAWLSVKSACVSTALCFLLALPTSYALTRPDVPLRGVIETVLELAMSLPYIVLGLSMLILFSSPLGKALKNAGFPVVFSKGGIVLAQLIVNLPFAIRLCSTALRSVDRKYEQVAGLLGASPGRSFFTVLLPMCSSSLVSAALLVWSRALGEFGATLMLVGVTRLKTETLPGSIYLNVSTNDLPAALASAFLLLVLSALALGGEAVVRHAGRKLSRYD